MKNKKQKRLLLCLCCALMISTVSIAACRSGSNSSDSEISSPTTSTSASDSMSDSAGGTPEEVYGEASVFYFDLDEKDDVAEYLISFTGNAFTLLMNDEAKSGSYTAKDGQYTLTFDGSEETASATLVGNVLSLEYNGNTYNFLKKVSYTVTYESNGGSAVASQKVLNGKTLAKPADPTLDGYNFIAWYADAEYTNAFAFGSTPITANTTLYARFEKTSVGESEYEAQLIVDGEAYATQKTVGGVLYELPTPVKEGRTFAGWWVSHLEDESKLSYKYEEQKLSENAKLYAVWVSDAPAVSASATGLTWTMSGTVDQYAVKITAPDGSVSEDTTAVTQYSYDFSKKDAGVYAIEVSANGKATTVYYENKALDRVSIFTVAEPSVLVYNAVKNAEKYVISIVCGNEEHSHVNIDNGLSTNFNFANCAMMPGGIQFTVKAMANGYVTSVSETFTYSRDLDPVTGLTLGEDADTIVWNPVARATSYTVEIVQGEKVAKVNVGTATTFNLKNYSGEMLIKVYPVTKNYNSPQAATLEYNKLTLAAPTGLIFNGTAFTWTAVEGATGYKVTVGDKVFDATENTLALSEDMYVDGQDSYKVSVQAVSSSDTSAASAYSDAITFNRTTMDPVLVYDKGIVSWSPVANATRYVIKVNDGMEVPVQSNVTSMAVTLTKKGANIISVRCYDKEERESDWATITVNAYAISFDPCGGATVDTIYKAYGDKIELPTTTLDGYKFVAWYNVPGGPENSGAKYDDEYFTENNDIGLYAYWSAESYNVTFEVGIYGQMEEGSVDVVFNKDYKLPVATSQDTTKVFGGWYEEANGQGIQYTDMEGNSLRPWSDAKDVTLHAGWLEVFAYTLIDEGNAYAVSKGAGINYVSTARIPETYNGKPVKIILPDAFENCKNLVSIDIPDTITSISLGITYGDKTAEDSAFQGCSALKAINVYCPKEDHSSHETYYESIDGALIYNSPTEANVRELVWAPATGETKYAIPAGVTHIAPKLFSSSYYKTLVIPASVTYIGEQAFYSAEFIEVIFEKAAEGTEEVPLVIAERAFGWCDKMPEITLPSRLASFNANVFYYASLLEAVYIDGEDGLYTSTKDGLLCKAIVDENGNPTAQKTIVYCPTGKTGSYTIPVGITAIGDEAFSQCDSLTEVIIPGYVTEIGYRAFYSCNNIAKVSFSDDAISLKIGEQAFYACSGLQEIYIPEGVTEIGSEAFRSCSGVSKLTFSESARAKIGASAFYGLTITELTIPKTLPSIGDSAFYNCSLLTQLTFLGAEGDTELRIESKAFYGCSGLTTVTLPGNLVFLGKNAFGNTSKLKEVKVEVGADAVLENGAFATIADSYAVTHVYLGKNVDDIEVTGIFGTIALVSVEVHEENENYTDIDGVLFDDEVTKILYYPAAKTGEYEIPDTVTAIGAGVFKGKTELTQIKFSYKVTSIGDNAFDGCTKLATIIFEETPENVEPVALTIGAEAFTDCKALTNFTLPVRTTTIGDRAFQSCEALTNIVIPEGVTTIGEYAFNGCKMLQTISFPSTVTALGSGEETNLGFRVLYGCAALTEITVATDNTAFGVKDGILYKKNEAGELSELLLCPIAKTGTADLPKTLTRVWSYAFNQQSSGKNESLKGIKFSEGLADGIELTFGSNVFYNCNGLEKILLPRGLKVIPAKLFSGCIGVKEIFIPNTVTSIEPQAFSNCKSLETLTFEEGGTEGLRLEDAVSSAGSHGETYYYGVFYDVKSPALKTITLPARTSYIGTYAFYSVVGEVTSTQTNTSTLESINIPAGVTEIADYAFYNCKKLTTLTFAENSSLERIGKYAFVDTGITNLVLPEGLQTLESAFTRSKITSVTLPASLTTIGDSAFSSCTQLTSVIFAEDSQLESIGIAAFSGCTALTTITLPASLKTISKNAFSGSNNLKTINFATTTVTEGETEIQACNLQTIGDTAFQGTGLERFDFPVSVNSLELGATLFSGCKKLTTVYLSRSVANIDNVLTKCASLKTVLIAADNQNFTADPELPLINNKEGTTIQFTYGALEGDTFTVPEGVKEIGPNAFEGQAFKKIVLPKSLLTISSSAFLKCANLETVEFADGALLTSIGDNAFQYCISLKEIKLPSGVTEIGKEAFSGCIALSNVTLNEGLATIGEKAFVATHALQTVKLPSTLTTLGNYAFQWSGLTEIAIPAGITQLGNTTGTFSTSTSCYAFQNCKNLTKVTLPETLTGIGYYAFDGCTNLTTINIPSTVTIIAGYAFRNCAKLNNITLPEGLEKTGSSIFEGCSSLTSINVPAMTTVGGSMFKNCTSLATVTLSPDLKKLAANMFQNTAITSIDLSNLTDVSQNEIFKDCTQLSSVTFNVNSTDIKKFGKGLFQNCTSLKKVALPNAITYMGTLTFMGSGLEEITLPTGLTMIGSSATAASATTMVDVFRDCVNLTTVNGLGAITKMSGGVFAGCTSLVSVDLSACTQIGKENFMGCTSLASVDLSLVTSLGQSAFAGCTALTSVATPKVTSMGTEAFMGCTSLESVTLNSAMTSTGTGSFKDCTSLKSITLPAKLTSVSAQTFMGCTALESISIPANVTYIGYSSYSASTATGYTFAGCTSLKSVTFEGDAKFKTFGAYSFYGCTSLTSITLPSSTTNFNMYAFAESGLTTVNLPKSVAKMARGVFSGCDSLTAFTVDAANTVYKAGADGALYSADGSTLICYPAGIGGAVQLTGITTIADGALGGCSFTQLVLPDTLTTINTYAFENCASLKELIIPDSVTSLGTYVFVGCNSLEKVTFGAGITAIANYAFQDCVTLKEVVLPAALETIGTYAFLGTSLQKVEIPSTVKTIGYGAFANNTALEEFIFATSTIEGGVTLTSNNTSTNYALFEDCTSLKKVVLPEGVTSLPYYAFYNCTSLTDVTLPKSLTTINNYVFQNCTSLKELTLHEGLITINMHAFSGSGIEEVIMPDTVTKASSNMFNGCTSLKTVKWSAGLPTMYTNAFYGCTALETVILPDTLTSIAATSFEGCTSLKSLVIPESVTSIGDGAFAGWGADQTIYVYGSQVDANKYWTLSVSSSTTSALSWWRRDCAARIVYNYSDN